MKTSFCKAFLAIGIVILVAGVIRASWAEPCGGIFEGDSGTAKFDPGFTSARQCVWILKLLTSSSLIFQLESIDDGATLNLYPEHAPTSLIIRPITLNSSSVGHSALPIKSQTLVLILTQNLDENYSNSPLSFSWDSVQEDHVEATPPKPMVSVNYMNRNEGQVSWTNFKIRHRSLFVLNVDHTDIHESLSFEAKGHLEPCMLPDPCRCSYFGAFEISVDGNLREVYRQCGQPFEFHQTGIQPFMVVIVHVNPSICLVTQDDPTPSPVIEKINSASNVLELAWTMGSFDNLTTTSTTTQTTSTMTTTGAPQTTTRPPTTTTPKPKPFTCPDSSLIVPCTCSHGKTVTCSMAQVTQAHVNGAIAAVRQANDVGENDRLSLSSFQVTHTNLLKLDLAPFVNIQLGRLEILSNQYLASLFMSTGGSADDDGAKLDVGYLQATSNALTDGGIPDLSLTFRTDTMTSLSFSGNKIKGLQPGDSESGEYLRGLSSLTALEQLSLYDTDTPKLYGGQFRRNRNLTSILLTFCERVELGPYAFALDEPEENMKNEILTIDLMYNQYQDQLFYSFDTTMFLGTRRPTAIKLSGNRLTYLSQTHFQEFLDTDDRNTVYADKNNFFCDDKMAWLKRGRELYEHRVLGVLCTNDPTETVFTTQLIS